MRNQSGHNIQLKALATILLGLFFFGPCLGQTKKKIDIRHADIHEYKKINGDDLVWLVGNVEYEHEGAIMNCDSSIYYRSENRFNAFGNVRINQGDSIFMKGDKMTYDGVSKMLHISGNVFLTEGRMRLSTDEIIYDRTQNIAYYNSGGTLIEDQTMLSSKMGFYNASTKRFVFRDSVRLANPKYNIIADTLEYGSESKIAYFFGPTNIISDSTTIYCEKGTFSTISEIANLTRNAVIVKKAQTIKGDSIHYKVKEGYGDITGKAYISDTINKYVISGGRAKYRERPEVALVQIIRFTH